jgi:hypothetical protein
VATKMLYIPLDTNDLDRLRSLQAPGQSMSAVVSSLIRKEASRRYPDSTRHGVRHSAVVQAVQKADSALSICEVMRLCGFAPPEYDTTRKALSRMVDAGILRRVTHGRYAAMQEVHP